MGPDSLTEIARICSSEPMIWPRKDNGDLETTFRMRLRVCIGILTVAVWLTAGAAEQPAAPPPAVEKVLHLFDQLRAADASRQAGKPQHVSFQLTDAEIDEYMRYSLKATPRPGLESVTMKFFPSNYISTFTVIDFDAVERWKPGTIPGIMRPVLSGKKSIWVDYRIQAKDGMATFSVEKAYYQDLRLPAFLVDKMIQIVASKQPEKYDTSKPLPLPFGLRQVWTANHSVSGQN